MRRLPPRPARELGHYAVSQEGDAEGAAIRGEDGSRQEQEEEVVLVAVADAAVDEDTVVVELCDAAAADGAVLGAGGLGEAAGAADLAGVE